MRKVKNNSKELPAVEFRNWIRELKVRRYTTEQAMNIAMNTQLLEFYWEIGKEICTREEIFDFDICFIKQLSSELEQEMPNNAGFSVRNLYAVRQWYRLYSQRYSSLPAFASQIPWSYHRMMITKTRDFDQLKFYCNETYKNQWNRSTLYDHMKTKLFERQKASVAAMNYLKDSDIWNCKDDGFSETLTEELMSVLPGFFLDLGSGFAFMGKQLPMNVDHEEYFVDMLFYHTDLRCYVVIKLKSGFYLPEQAEKVGAYLSVISSKIEKTGDHATIGILLFQQHNQLDVKYAFPVSGHFGEPLEYKLTEDIPQQLEGKVPLVQTIMSGLVAANKGDTLGELSGKKLFV